MAILASHGVGGFLTLWMRVWLILSVLAVAVAGVVDIVRGIAGRWPRHVAACIAAMLLVALAATPNLVWTEHEDQLPQGERHGTCLGCGVVFFSVGGLGFLVGLTINVRLRPEAERLAGLPPPPDP